MISVEEARRIMMEHVPVLPSLFLFPDEVSGYYLADDVVAPFDHPLFDMSAVDGYAVRGEHPWSVVGEVAAGDVFNDVLGDGECVRIFTGGQVPTSATTVVMQERCARDGNTVTYTGAPIVPGANIRRQAESIRSGELLLTAGTLLNPAAIGAMTSVGVHQVEVRQKPLVSILRTGGEFIDAEGVKPGRIFSSNDRMLAAALDEQGMLEEQSLFTSGDALNELVPMIRAAFENTDVLITTGGASVGEHDLVRTALERSGATIHFHGVAQKPGKPMLFATLGNKPVFALPGNPRAVLVLFHAYVLPFLRKMQGAHDPWPRTEQLPVSHALNVKGDRAEFRAAHVRNGRVTLLTDEGSHMLRSLIEADALAYLPPTQRTWNEGDPVEIHYLTR
ncbi:MAG: molybdopterin molybdotransferase MoeA [Flavobacteriales bacterium]|nr:MAG: molybdopterin molybdotransferase MoeA [Flavobacteriales bacterium]